MFMSRPLLILIVVLLAACAGQDGGAPAPSAAVSGTPERVVAAPTVNSLAGRALSVPDAIPDRDRLTADLAAAQAHMAANPDDPDALIWVARRLGYLWRYHEAIAVLDQGIERWPDNPRLYRHRGHRHITVRQFQRAEADLDRAAQLTVGMADEIEPDGAPNAAGIPRTTLFYNIRYHLGLARYLQGNYDGALAAYTDALAVSDNDDSIVAATDWLWMTLMRMGRNDVAATLLEGIHPGMDLLENTSYHRRLLMYKKLATPESLLEVESGDATAIATQGYGVGNYYYVNGEPDRAKAVFAKIIEGAGWNAFGYIAAEADLVRMP